MGTVFRVAYGYLRNHADAEDVTQAVLLKLFRSDVRFADDEHVKRWLIRATASECTSLYRTLRRRPENIDDYLETLQAPGSPDDGDAGELLREVMALPPRYSVPVYLYYYEGYGTREAAKLLGVPETTLRTRLARARRRLKDVLMQKKGGAGMRHEKTTGTGRGKAPEAGPTRQTAEARRIQAAFDLLGASEATYERVMDMTRNDPAREFADTRVRTHRMTRRAFVTCAALSAVAVGGVAYAAVETDFFRTAFGDKGLDDLEVRDVTDEVTGSTYTLPARQWASTDSEEAQRLIGDYVERIDESVSHEGYTLTLGSCVVDENGLGIADFTLENPKGLDIYEPTAQEYGELFMDEDAPIGGVRVTDAMGEKNGCSFEIINWNSSVETSVAGASYFDIARANGMTIEGGVGWSLPSRPHGQIATDVISFLSVRPPLT